MSSVEVANTIWDEAYRHGVVLTRRLLFRATLECMGLARLEGWTFEDHVVDTNYGPAPLDLSYKFERVDDPVVRRAIPRATCWKNCGHWRAPCSVCDL